MDKKKFTERDICTPGSISNYVAVLKVQPFNEMGRPLEIINSFGGKPQYRQAINELEIQLYKDVN